MHGYAEQVGQGRRDFEAPPVHHVGAPILHGYRTSSAPQGEGGASRIAAAAAPLNVGFPQNLSFFLWLIVIGVLIPVAIIGGLKVGGFQFVFKGR